MAVDRFKSFSVRSTSAGIGFVHAAVLSHRFIPKLGKYACSGAAK